MVLKDRKPGDMTRISILPVSFLERISKAAEWADFTSVRSPVTMGWIFADGLRGCRMVVIRELRRVLLRPTR